MTALRPNPEHEAINVVDTKTMQAAMNEQFIGECHAAVREGSAGRDGIRFMRLHLGDGYDWANVEVRLYRGYTPITPEEAKAIAAALNAFIKVAQGRDT